MRILRATAFVVIVALGGILGTSPASAQISQASIGQPLLGPEGASLLATVTVVCDVGYNIGGVQLTVVQSVGGRLAQGAGYFNGPYPACTGAPQPISLVVQDYSPWAYKKGSASATAFVYVYDPATGSYAQTSVGPQDVRISSK